MPSTYAEYDFPNQTESEIYQSQLIFKLIKMTHTLNYINERGERVTARNLNAKDAGFIRDSCVVLSERMHVASTGQTRPRVSEHPGVTVYVASGFLARFWGKPDRKVELNPFQTRELMGRILKS